MLYFTKFCKKNGNIWSKLGLNRPIIGLAYFYLAKIGISTLNFGKLVSNLLNLAEHCKAMTYLANMGAKDWNNPGWDKVGIEVTGLQLNPNFLPF